ncbi:MAG: NIPSNAP family protein [Chloroflexi bacterium]|nr:NIPSNAP family protein [Chloroflexota bacterium]OJV99881.1 MAG: hypothetical protein BGO39_29355 [Chloroflexi bacterium 54-19]
MENCETEISDSHQAEIIERCCPVLELRQYTLYPGRRDVLIELFEREFLESQEAVGIKVVGTFRRLDAPDQFVWLRGFPDMVSRAQSLQSFYGGDTWKAHCDAANATMIDSDNVLLLRPVGPGSGFNLAGLSRNPVGGPLPGGLVVANIYYFAGSVPGAFPGFFEREMKPVLAESGVTPLGEFVTEASPNTFPALPVREGENVFVWFEGFPGLAAYNQHLANLEANASWKGHLAGRLTKFLAKEPEVLKLVPTARSLLK